MKAMDCPCCCSIVPMPSLDASVSIKKVSLKLGMASVGVLVMAFFKLINAFSTFGFHPNCPFLRRFVSGQANIPYPWTNFL